MSGLVWEVCPWCSAEVGLRRNAYAVTSALWSTADHLAANGHECETVKQERAKARERLSDG